MELRICFTGILFYFFLIFFNFFESGIFDCLDFFPPPPFCLPVASLGGRWWWWDYGYGYCMREMRGGSYFIILIFYGYTDLYRIYRWMV